MSTRTRSSLPQFGLGDRMRKARELANLDQSDLAEKLDVSRALVSLWERGKSDPRSDKLRRWAEETGQPLAWLLGLDVDDEAPSTMNGATGVSHILAGQAA